MKTTVEIIGVIIGTILTVLLVAFIMSIPLYYLWNWLMPIVFGLTKITFFQAMGLSFLSSCIFKGGGSSNNSN